jgi:ABC-type spermidine/putrescine transport system permease subunit II
MRRAYLVIAIPAVVVGIFYLAIFHALGIGVGWAPFLGAAVAFVTALLLVRRHQHRKVRSTRRTDPGG